MNRLFMVEMLDNGLVYREDNGYTRAVLYNEESYSDEDAQFADCHKEMGKMILDEMLSRDGDLAKESKEKYAKTGKPTIGFMVKMEVLPLCAEEIHFLTQGKNNL